MKWSLFPHPFGKDLVVNAEFQVNVYVKCCQALFVEFLTDDINKCNF